MTQTVERLKTRIKHLQQNGEVMNQRLINKLWRRIRALESK